MTKPKRFGTRISFPSSSPKSKTLTLVQMSNSTSAEITWKAESNAMPFNDGLRAVKIDLFAGITLTCSTVYTWLNFKSTCSALNKLQQVKSVPISDLRSLLLTNEEDNLLVEVHGIVKPEPNWKTLLGVMDTIKSESNGEVFNSVISEKLVKFKRESDVDWLRWISDAKLSFKTAPFVVCDGECNVNVDLIRDVHPQVHSIPLVTVFRDSWINIVNPFRDGVVYEKILPVGKEISAVGVVYCEDGKYPHIKACDDLPYFLSDFTKDQMVQHLGNKRVILFVGGIVLGSLSVCVLTYSLRRYWRRWKQVR